MKKPCIHSLHRRPPPVYAVVLALLMASWSVSAEPPKAKFTVTPLKGPAPLDVSLNATNSEGSNKKYWWAFFPEGTLEEGNKIRMKTFTTKGIHSIVLIVEDTITREVGVIRKSVEVTQGLDNQPPVADFTFEVNELQVALTSTSTDADGTVVKWSWTTPKGTSVGSTATVTLSPGEHSVTLTVEDDKGLTASVTKTVTVGSSNPPPVTENQPPVANFTYTEAENFSVFLDGSASTDPEGGPLAYQWQLPNGTASGQKSTWRFDNAGTYDVTLTVTDNKGATSAPTTKKVTVAAPNAAPTAAFTYAIAYDKNTGPKINLDGSTSSDPEDKSLTYQWQSGDQTANGQVTSLNLLVGSHNITLTVTDEGGATASKTQTVEIAQPPPDYNTTARNFPQIIAAGMSPSLVNMTDTQFSIVALVRPGTAPIRAVTFQDTAGTMAAAAMTHKGTLANGDEFYQTTFAYAPGNFPSGTKFETAWGSQNGQFNIVARDEAEQLSQTYPYLKIGNYAAIDEAEQATKPATPLSYDSTRRYSGPQVIMVGYSPAVIDKNDTEFDIVAIVRPGSTDIASVTLKSGTERGFRAGMTLAGELDNGDKMYKFPFAINPSALLGNEAGYVELRDVWGPAADQFGIEATDKANQKSHKFPNVEFGYFPEYKPE